jgi:hypothetical protein
MQRPAVYEEPCGTAIDIEPHSRGCGGGGTSMASATAASTLPRPRGFQFSIGTLLATMIGIGVACAGLAMPTAFWAGTLASLALLSLLTSLLIAVHRGGVARAMAVGFLIFGGGYLGCVLALDHSLRKTDNDAPMPTSRAAWWVYLNTHAHHRHAVTMQMGGGNFLPGSAAPPPAPRVVQVPLYRPENFVEVVHSVLLALLGLIGGLLSRYLFVTSRHNAADQNSIPPPK